MKRWFWSGVYQYRHGAAANETGNEVNILCHVQVCSMPHRHVVPGKMTISTLQGMSAQQHLRIPHLLTQSTMRSFSSLLAVCGAATSFLSTGATPLEARQISVPPNEQIFTGPLIRWGLNGPYACGPTEPGFANVSKFFPVYRPSYTDYICSHRLLSILR